MPLMNFACPHCTQSLEIADEWAGRAVYCPNCQQALAVPSAPAIAIPKVAPTPQAPRRSFSSKPPRRGSGGFWRFLLLLMVCDSLDDAAYYRSWVAITHVSLTGGDGGNPSTPEAPFFVLAAGWDRQVQLRWNESFGATGNHVKCAPTGDGPYTTLAMVPGTTYTDVAVSNGTTYHYAVSAMSAKGESANCPPDAATPRSSMANVASGGAAEDSESNPDGNEGVEKAFDLNPGTKWLGPVPSRLRYDLARARPGRSNATPRQATTTCRSEIQKTGWSRGQTTARPGSRLMRGAIRALPICSNSPLRRRLKDSVSLLSIECHRQQWRRLYPACRNRTLCRPT